MFVIALIAFGILALYLANEHWPRSMEGEYFRLWSKWQRDCEQGGLDFNQRQDELKFRHAMIRLRDRANKAALTNGSGIKEKIAEIAEKEARSLATRDRALARNFLRVVLNTELSDILYHDGLAALDRHYRKTIPDHRAAVTEQDLAALRNV